MKKIKKLVMTPMKLVNTSGFEVGDSIIVKPDILCPDYPALSFAGWQGWITDISPEEKTLEIAWDSAALHALPTAYIQDSAQQGLSWTSMILGWQDILHWPERSTLGEAEETRERLTKRHRWAWISDTNPGISEILVSIEEANFIEELSVWEEHLSRTLIFPFEAQRDEFLFPGSVPTGTMVKVKGLAQTHEHYGLMAHVLVGATSDRLALCELEATDHESPNYLPLNDYVMWFANR